VGELTPAAEQTALTAGNIATAGIEMFIHHSKKRHPHLGATYEIMERGGGYTVYVNFSEARPATIFGLTTPADAERWIEYHLEGIAQGFPGDASTPG
jgi:hypothetical protein